MKKKVATAQAQCPHKSSNFWLSALQLTLVCTQKGERAKNTKRQRAKSETSTCQIEMATDASYTSHIETVIQRIQEISVPVRSAKVVFEIDG